MQDGVPISGDDANAWLREHFKDDPNPEVRIEWAADEEPDEGTYNRLLQILFSPRHDSPAA